MSLPHAKFCGAWLDCGVTFCGDIICLWPQPLLGDPVDQARFTATEMRAAQANGWILIGLWCGLRVPGGHRISGFTPQKRPSNSWLEIGKTSWLKIFLRPILSQWEPVKSSQVLAASVAAMLPNRFANDESAACRKGQWDVGRSQAGNQLWVFGSWLDKFQQWLLSMVRHLEWLNVEVSITGRNSSFRFLWGFWVTFLKVQNIQRTRKPAAPLPSHLLTHWLGLFQELPRLVPLLLRSWFSTFYLGVFKNCGSPQIDGFKS